MIIHKRLRQFTIFILQFSFFNSLTVPAAEPLHKTLVSADRKIHVEAWHTKIKGGGLVRKETLHGGKQDGVDVITVENGKLKLSVIPTRGMSIAEVRMDDIRLGWNSPVKEIVHPKLINLQSRGGLGWLEGFNEWMVRCGLEFAGHPGKDEFINNVGDKAEMDLTLHGKIGNIPASEVEFVIDRDAPHRIHIRGRVDERMFYGPKLELWTEISTEIGSSQFRVEDTIRNYSAFDQEFQIIYHCNYGPPLLEAGAKFVGAPKRVTPFNAHAAKGVQQFAEYIHPTKGFIEQVYCIEPYANRSGKTTVMLHNASATKAVAMTWAVESLPFFTLWKNTNAEEEGYVTGLEPGTGYPYNRRIERKAGRVPKLKPGEQRSFAIDFEILRGTDQVARAVNSIKELQANRSPQIDEQPAKVE
jgi:hypothetical protein